MMGGLTRRLRCVVIVLAAGAIGLLVFSSLFDAVILSGRIPGRPFLMLSFQDGSCLVGYGRAPPGRVQLIHLFWHPRLPRFDNWMTYARGGQYILRVPMLWIALPLAGAAVWLQRVHTRRVNDFVEGGCSLCGYDLSGISGASCPECGSNLKRIGDDDAGCPGR